MTVVDLGMNIGRRNPHRGWPLRNPYNERLPGPMKVTIEIEAPTDAEAVAVMRNIANRAERNRLISTENNNIDLLRCPYSVRVHRENKQTTAPDPRGALDRIAATLDLIEGHMRPVIVEAKEKPMTVSAAIAAALAPLPDGVGTADTVMPDMRPASQRVHDNLRWISNIAYNMKQGASASNIGPEGEFSRILEMANAIAAELGVKLP